VADGARHRVRRAARPPDPRGGQPAPVPLRRRVLARRPPPRHRRLGRHGPHLERRDVPHPGGARDARSRQGGGVVARREGPRHPRAPDAPRAVRHGDGAPDGRRGRRVRADGGRPRVHAGRLGAADAQRGARRPVSP
jgi:hypothetical protein